MIPTTLRHRQTSVPCNVIDAWLLSIPVHPFNGFYSRTTWLSWYQKGKTSLDLNEARDDGVWDAVAAAGPCANKVHLAPDR